MKLSLHHEITKSNHIFTKKLLMCWSLTIAAFFFSIIFDVAINALTHIVAAYIPSISKLLNKGTLNSLCAANYFSLVALLLPAMTLLLIWKEDILLRTRFGAEQLARHGRGPIERIFLVYVLGVPSIIFILYVFYAAPFSLPERPHLFGQHVINFMLNSKFGLLIFGSVCAVAAALFSVFAIGLFWWPIAYLLANFGVLKNE